MTSLPPQLRIGILGAANIAKQFAASVKHSKYVKVTAIASRTKEAAEKFANELAIHTIDTHYGSYEALLNDANLDIIYIPLPNTMHAHWAIKAAQHGKHVLCEKPMALNLAKARQMYAAAHAHKVMLLEAFPYYFQPQTGVMMALIADGSIGEVKSVQASFGFAISQPVGNIRLSPDLGGGALLDAGSYPLSLIRLVMGCAPVSVTGVADWHCPNVDISMHATLHYADGRNAQMSCAMNVANHRHATIVGTQGTLETEYLNHNGIPLPSRLSIRRGIANSIGFEAVPAAPGTHAGSGFRFCAEAFAQKINTRDVAALKIAEQHSLDNAAVLDAIAKSARLGSTVEVY
jgi:predicted dehydrogenase